MTKLLWLVAALVTVYACAEATGTMGEVMRDAGQSLMDASDGTADASSGADGSTGSGGNGIATGGTSGGGGTPGGQVTVKQYPCVVTHTFTTQTDRYTQTHESYGAAFSDPALKDKLQTAYVCDHTYYGTATLPNACPDGATCTGSRPDLDCWPSLGGYDHDGTVRFDCGYRYRTTFTDDTPATDTGRVAAYVRVVVGD
jgi:hypothetical protein